MFCSKCGSSNGDGLKFCKNCGNRLSGEVEDNDGTPGKMLDNLLTTIFLIVMFGLGILVGLIAVLLGSGMRTEPVVVIALAYIAAVFGICFVLVRQVPKLINAKLKTSSYGDDGVPSVSTAPQLRPVTTAQLGEHREPVGSVVDHTTRMLEHEIVGRRE